MARAFALALENQDEMRGEAYNVGSESMNCSKQQICDRIQHFLPEFHVHHAEVGVDEDKRNYVVSYDKIESTGFETEASIDQGIEELVHGLPAILGRRRAFSNA